MSTTTDSPTGRLDLHSTIAALAQLNRAPELGGITREVYTPEYDQAVDLTAEFMRQCGLTTRVDAAGNLIGRLEGRDPSLERVMTGSHIDTTLNAGRFDGVVGVLGGAEALRRLREVHGGPRRTIELVAFAGEEPRFGMGCVGSQLMAGKLGRGDLDALIDRDGVTAASAMRSVGLDPDRVGDAVANLSDIHAVLELHIEQGGLLESEQVPLGVVTAIAAAHDFKLTLSGQAAHAGATPMALRRDALAGAAEIVLEVERLASESPSGRTVGTVGTLGLEPGATNIIPGEVMLVVDIRDSDLEAREAVVTELIARIDSICERRSLQRAFDVIQRNAPCACAPEIIAAARDACAAIDEPFLEMQSGAYHDCMSFSPEVPIGMIFVPSERGLSHHPDEFTEAAAIDIGVEALSEALWRLTA